MEIGTGMGDGDRETGMEWNGQEDRMGTEWGQE